MKSGKDARKRRVRSGSRIRTVFKDDSGSAGEDDRNDAPFTFEVYRIVRLLPATRLELGYPSAPRNHTQKEKQKQLKIWISKFHFSR